MTDLPARPTQNGQPDGKANTAHEGAKPSAQAAMDALCRSVAEVLRITPSAPTRLQVQIGSAMVMVEWSESGVVPAMRSQSEPEVVPVPPTHYVVSAPLVGTFYRASEPGARPFVELGDVVAPGDQVAIIEAMKLMNPVHAEQSGRLVESPVDNGAPVEYGQPLLVFEPVGQEAAS